MMERRLATLSLAVVAIVFALGPPAVADSLPTRIGQCTRTTIKSVEARLMDSATHAAIPDSGSAVVFANGGYQVDYVTVPAVEASRPGDPVVMCLVSIPQHCPPGDDRGRMYKTTNERTRQSWTLPDSEHMCGGA